MFLFELAMELDARSADMAEAAPSLGLEGITPTSELTPEQIQALRARFTKTPVAAGPGGPAGGGAYHPPTWGPPPGAPGPAAPAPSGGGLGIGQMVVIALAIVGVLGLFAFMFKNGGTDQKRLDRIAAAEPESDEVLPTGPNGKPLTKEQRQDVVKLEAVKAANQEKVCSVLRQIRNADIAATNSSKAAGSLEELKTGLLQASNDSIPLYDQAIPVIPEQADNMRKLQQFSRDTISSVQASSDPTDLQNRMAALTDQATSTGVVDAAIAFDSFAMDACGFSVGNN